MPTYQYACTQCGHRLEAVQRFTDPALTECPECTGRLRKVFSSVGVVFKGSGFYRTDSRAKPEAAKNGSSSTKETAAGGTNGAAKPEGSSSSGDAAKPADTSASSKSSAPAAAKSA